MKHVGSNDLYFEMEGGYLHLYRQIYKEGENPLIILVLLGRTWLVWKSYYVFWGGFARRDLLSNAEIL